MLTFFGIRALALLTFGAVLSAVPAAAAPAPLTGPQVGSPAPDFALVTLDGKPARLADYRGRTLVINVWATWCPPCRQETADLNEAYRALKGPRVAFLGVDATEQAPIIRAFVAAKGVAYPQAVDEHKSFSAAYDIRNFPTTFVIDPHGVIRARYVDIIAPAQLASFVASAKLGRDGVIASPLQDRIDATLDPQKFVFSGDHDVVSAGVQAAASAIAAADKMMDESDAAHGRPTDFLRTRAEQAALRDRAIAALNPLATEADKALLARLRGDAAADREAWAPAVAAYQEALARKDGDEDALAGLAFAASAAKDYPTEIDAYARLAKLHPESADAQIELGVAYQQAKEYPAAQAALANAIAVAGAAYAKDPKNPLRIRKVAATHLFAGRAYAKAGDRAKAHAEFAQLTAWTLRLPKTDIRYAMYLEEAQEADVALSLEGAARGGRTAILLGPWTGADLPGSIPSTLKYRLVVAGVPGKNVDLRAAGVPKGWVASFCTDRVCAPFHVPVTVPAQGVKVIEFQLVPGDDHAKVRARVTVIAREGGRTVEASTLVVAKT